MKKLFVSLFIFVSFSVFAQTDSSKMDISVTLRQRHHAYIIGLLGDRGTIDKINYINQLKAKIDTSYSADSLVTVSVPASLVVDVYLIMGGQAERIAAVYNDEIKKLLLPAVVSQGQTWLLRQLGGIKAGNDKELSEAVDRGKNFILSIRLQ